MSKLKIILDDDSKQIFIQSSGDLNKLILNEIVGKIKINKTDSSVEYIISLLPYNCFVLWCVLRKSEALYNDNLEILEKLKVNFPNITRPKLFYLNDKHIGLTIPSIPTYTKLISLMSASHQKLTTYTIPIGRVYESLRYAKNFKHPFLPNILIDETLDNFVKTPLSENKSLEDLFQSKTTDLVTVMKGYKVNPDGMSKLKYESSADILLKRPERYTDRTETFTKKTAPYGKYVFFKGEIIDTYVTFSSSFVVTIKDENLDTITFAFYKQDWLTTKFKIGDVVIINGMKVPDKNWNALEIFHKEDIDALPIAPVYRQSPTNKITSNLLINSVQEIFYRFDGNNLANYIQTPKTNFWKTLYNLHFPKNVKEYSGTLDDLAYYELVFLQLLFQHKQATEKKSLGVIKKVKNPTLMNKALDSLSYKLTSGQSEAIQNIILRLNSDYAENILLSGDVGTGKTTVAQAACLYTVESGYQAVLIAPTEILAQQLYKTFLKMIEPLDIKPTIEYLSGNTKTKEKKEILNKVAKGETQILVGTHTLFNIEYKNLGLIVIDEQQKFGAEQRESLLNSRKDGRKPDILAQTATPIPRSTALAFYGDIDLIPLSEKPGNRKENITNWIEQSADEFLDDIKNPTWKHIFKEIESGHQVFIVTPAVDESAKSASVKKTENILKTKFKNINIATVHGKIDKNKQNKVIESFRKGDIQILIASSIIEVGVDIPNSTIMLVLDADKFGASALHQIRGRVGRSDLQGYCYLISEGKTKNSRKRLESLVASNDGFQIALVDLETRKEGDLFGTQQSGESNLRFCNLTDHTSLIEQAKAEAIRIYNSDFKDIAISDAKAFLKRGNESEV